MKPKISFVVPCFNLAFLLPECIESILSQTYGNFEIIIMDDCSPDATEQVARSFTDARVRYVRNEFNLGHLRNYNKGIELSAGDYIWLISADDRLRVPHVLARYVKLLEARPEIGFAFCAGIALEDGKENGIVRWAAPETQDTIFPGQTFLRRLLDGNCVLAPSAMARRSCYQKISMFPTDLPFAGDWYLWCAFALHHDVAYFAEPMVNYRMHNLGMTNVLLDRNVAILSEDDLAVRWRLKRQIEDAGIRSLAEFCEKKIAQDYAANLTSRYHPGTNWASKGKSYVMNFDEFKYSLAINTRSAEERDRIRRRVLTEMGTHLRAVARTPRAWLRYAGRTARNPRLLMNYVSYMAQQLGSAVSYTTHRSS